MTDSAIVFPLLLGTAVIKTPGGVVIGFQIFEWALKHYDIFGGTRGVNSKLS